MPDYCIVLYCIVFYAHASWCQTVFFFAILLDVN